MGGMERKNPKPQRIGVSSRVFFLFDFIIKEKQAARKKKKIKKESMKKNFNINQFFETHKDQSRDYE
jgi:hypothetical protein